MKPGIGRRQFMQKSLAGVAAAPAIVHVLGEEAAAYQSGSPNDKIQVGIIGVGARVQSGVLQAAVAVPGVEVIGVCDAYKGRVTRALERLGSQAKDYGDWRAMLADKSIDAVIIATPDHWHREQTVAALAAGKDVYLEKPMTLTIDEGPEMYAAADKSGRVLQVGSNGMSSKLQQTARELVQSGKLGKIHLIRASYDRNSDSGAWLYPIPPDADPKTVDWEMFLGPAPKRPFSLERFFRWRCYWDYSGGISTDLFVHLMTTIHYVMGATVPESVVRHRRQLPPPEDARGARHAQRLGHVRQGKLHGPAGRDLQQHGRRRERLRDPGQRRLARLPRRPDDFHAREPARRQQLDRRVLALEPGEGVLGRPRGPEARDAGHLAARRWRSKASRGARSAPTRPCCTWPASSTRCARASRRSRTAAPATTPPPSRTW